MYTIIRNSVETGKYVCKYKTSVEENNMSRIKRTCDYIKIY